MNYQVADTIEYTTFDGSVRRVYVQSKENNIKNGLSGFTGILEDAGQFDADPDGYGVWGYDHQITKCCLTLSWMLGYIAIKPTTIGEQVSFWLCVAVGIILLWAMGYK